MAFYRRFMLLNMGSPGATMFTLIAASIEEASALLRSAGVARMFVCVC